MLYQSLNPHGGDVYQPSVQMDFSANVNPFGTPAGILEAIKRSLNTIHCYPDPYCRELVQSIADFEKVPREYILCGNGAAELIYSYCAAVKPGHAVELAPTFSEYALGLRQVGCRITRYYLQQRSGFELTEDFPEFLAGEKPDVVFLCNPNNPSGKLISMTLLQRILDCCKDQQIQLLLDECFLDLTDRGESLKTYLSDYPQLLILKAFTKSYGMAGIRLGYCMSSNAELLKRMAQTVQPWNVSIPAQAAGIAALQEQAFLQKTKNMVRIQRQWLTMKLESFGFWVCPSEANFLLFHAPEALYGALQEKGISIRNCDNYHGLSAGWYRIAVRLPEENQKLIETIAQIAERVSLWQKI